jgi:hypothetical protein
MKRMVLLAALAVAAPAMAEVGVGLSVSVDQPGLYGRIDIGNQAPPPVIYSQPVVIVSPSGPPPAPIYLHVPPGHEKHWRKHCAEYRACGQPVYFVHDDWYRTVYEPRHRGGDHDGGGRDDDDRGNGNGTGHGKGKGHGHGHGHDN